MISIPLQKRKGVSPLIAVIVLIALTMIVAGIIATFTQTFSQRTLGEAATCSTASAIISGASYDGSELTVVIENDGDLDLSFDVAVVFSDLSRSDDEGSTITATPSLPLSVIAGAKDSVTFSDSSGSVPSNINQVTIKSVECQGIIQDFLPADFIIGLGS